ncbi:MGF 505-2R [African swine fever virus]|uniref:MGF 505-2R n=1 Tax=African swine fever virus TaxID=10497 RepID=A0A894ZUY5_ASF|nr:MGF 505-2R [African swine fever virus]
MFSLQDLCRKHLFILPDVFGEHVLQQLGLYWEKHGSLQRIGNDHILIRRDLILSINEALKIAAEEGNNEVVKLLLLWKGNLHYAIIGALQGDQYDLIHTYENQIEDYHHILPLIQDAKTFEKCHALERFCVVPCLLEHAIKHNMLPILQKYQEELFIRVYLRETLFELACLWQRNDILKWIEQTMHVYDLKIIFNIAISKRDLSMYSLGYVLLFDRGNTEATLLTQHLEKTAAKGLLHFVLETLKYGGNINIVLSQAVKYNHRKLLDYFLRQLPRKNIEKLLLLAVQEKASKKTLNLLLSYLNYSVKRIKKLLRYVIEYESTLVIRILLKKRINLIDAVLEKTVRYFSETKVKTIMDELSISPERVIKMAIQKMRTDIVIQTSYIWEDDLERLIRLKNMVYTIKYEHGKKMLMKVIHGIYKNLLHDEKEKVMFHLAKFYIAQNAATQFRDICKDCCKLDVARFKPRFKQLILDCLDIITKKTCLNIMEILENHIISLFAMKMMTEDEKNLGLELLYKVISYKMISY